jgi:hypothetical protein
MRNLVLTSILFGAALSATGCIIVDDDDDDDRGGSPPGYDRGEYATDLRTSWKLVSGQNSDGTAAQNATCQRGRNAAATLYSCPGTPEQCTNPASAFGDVGNCDTGQGSGTIDVPFAGQPRNALPEGHYTVWYEFSADGQVYAKSFAQEVDLRAGESQNLDFEVQVDHGFFDLAWVLTSGSSTLQCADVAGQNGVALDTTLTGTDVVIPSEWDCAPGVGRTYAIPFNEPGYVNVATLIAGSGDAIGTSIDEPADDFAFGNEAQDLGTVAIEVD